MVLCLALFYPRDKASATTYNYIKGKAISSPVLPGAVLTDADTTALLGQSQPCRSRPHQQTLLHKAGPTQPGLRDPPQIQELILFGACLLVLQLAHFSLSSHSKTQSEQGRLPLQMQNHLPVTLRIHRASLNCSTE